MRLIVGLGNPGLRYAPTRHNIGFRAIDLMAQRYEIPMGRQKHEAIMGEGMIGDEQVILAKPLTYMNASGRSVRSILASHGMAPEDLIVIYDDLALDLGRLRVRQQGSAGGHNGVKSLIDCLRSQCFARIRLGVGPQPPGVDAAEYVLGSFAPAEWSVVRAVMDKSIEVLETCLSDGVDTAMNRYNSWKFTPNENQPAR